jgi:hypothetical protein
MNTKWWIGAVLTLIIIAGGFGLWLWTRSHSVQKEANQSVPDESAPTQNAQSEVIIGLPSGVKIAFDNLPGCGVIKSHEEKQYTYNFFCQELVFGRAFFTGDWHVDHFLSYSGSEELFGLFPDRSGEKDKYYWGPSVLYRMNTEQKFLGKLIDLSFSGSLGTEQATRSWGSNYFITDVSRDQSQVVYCNYFSKNTLFIRNIRTGLTREYPVAADLYDFGDATFSDDGTKIAFAGLSGKSKGKDGKITFGKATIFILDSNSGKITSYKTEQKSGMYSINGWRGDVVDSEFIPL